MMQLARSLEQALRLHPRATHVRLLPTWPALCATDSHPLPDAAHQPVGASRHALVPDMPSPTISPFPHLHHDTPSQSPPAPAPAPQLPPDGSEQVPLELSMCSWGELRALASGGQTTHAVAACSTNSHQADAVIGQQGGAATGQEVPLLTGASAAHPQAAGDGLAAAQQGHGPHSPPQADNGPALGTILQASELPAHGSSSAQQQQPAPVGGSCSSDGEQQGPLPPNNAWPAAPSDQDISPTNQQQQPPAPGVSAEGCVSQGEQDSPGGGEQQGPVPPLAQQGPTAPLAEGPAGLTLTAFSLGLPSRPLVTAVCQSLAAWVITRQFPFPQVEQHTPALLSESPEYHEKKAWLTQQVSRLLPAHAATHDDLATAESWQALGDTLDWEVLGDIMADPQAVLILLGFRITTGTTRDLGAVPGVMECVEAFGTLHAPESKSKLSVGGRALSKHCHRDSSTQFWGSPKGPEVVKNGLAADVLMRLLQGAVWVNLHYLPPDKHVLEMRVKQGYGARWEVCHSSAGPPGTTSTPSPQAGKQGLVIKFRGFLEPQSPEGHELGWRH